MNSFQRFQDRLVGKWTDRAPNFNIYMSFAAHHIGAKLSDYYLDYRVLCDANFAMAEDFGCDILQTISDPYREAYDFGMEINFPLDGLPLPVRPLLTDPDHLANLKPIQTFAGRRMSDRIEAVRLLRSQSGGQIPVMGWVEGPLAEAANLRGVSTLLTDLSDRPEWVKDLLELIVEQEISFARDQIKAGADIIGLGDAVASQISPRMYRSFALPYEQQIFTAIREMGALPRLHICGDTSRILADMARSGAGIIDVDYMVDYSQAVRIFEDSPIRPAVCGNIPPVSVFYQGTPEDVQKATARCLEQGGARCFLAGGCEIPDETSHANLHTFHTTLSQFNEHA